MVYRTYIHNATGERISMDENRPDAQRMEESGDFTTQGGRIVETAGPEASRIGYQRPDGNTSASTTDLNSPRTDDEDAEDETTEDEEVEGEDEFDRPPTFS